MTTITIPKKEYQELVEKKLRYEYFRQMIEEDIFASPPEKSSKKIIKFFKETGKYNRAFLNSLKRGLGRSFYFKA